MRTSEKYQKKYAYDLEIYPNFLCVTFLDCDSKETFVFSIYRDNDNTNKLKEFLDRKIQLIGFNNISYDGPMLQYVFTHTEKDLLTNLFKLSGRLISDESKQDKDLLKLRYPRDVKRSQMDLMKIMAFDRQGVSLKQIAINLKWRKIQDLPLPYDHIVQPHEIDIILEYNLNDVLITYELYNAIQPQINLRSNLGKLFHVNLTNASDSKMANILLENIYAKESNMNIKQLRDLRTKHNQFRLSECISSNIKFQTIELNSLKEDLEKILVTADNKFGYRKTINFGGTEYELGIGGLHSKDKPQKFTTTDQFIIRDADVSSYYPNIMINNKIKPAHLGDDFIRILQNITKERIEAKKSNNKVKADGLKITINSIFGKLGSGYFWLEDAKAMLSVTVSGQLYLLMLIEALVLSDIFVISANTDGIITKIPRECEEKYKEICDWWQKKTRFDLEVTDYTLYVRSGVNNYITKKSNGETKEKGQYIKEIKLKKGYKHPIVARCLYEYYINGKSVEQTLAEADDILDFCISQKSGQNFMLEYRDINNVTKLQKTNRFYISNHGGILVKKNIVTNSEIGLFVGKHTRLLNDFNESVPLNDYDINFSFYKNEAKKSIEEIEPSNKQFNIFEILPNSHAKNSNKPTKISNIED